MFRKLSTWFRHVPSRKAPANPLHAVFDRQQKADTFKGGSAAQVAHARQATATQGTVHEMPTTMPFNKSQRSLSQEQIATVLTEIFDTIHSRSEATAWPFAGTTEVRQIEARMMERFVARTGCRRKRELCMAFKEVRRYASMLLYGNLI